KEGAAEVNVVLRISRKFIAELTTKKLQRTDPVHLQINDDMLDGQAYTDATFSVQFDANTQESVFFLELKGTTTSATVSDRPYVRVLGSGRMNFTVRKRVNFDGLKYQGKPTTVDATLMACVDRVQTPRGLFGLIIQWIAMPRIRESQPLIAQVAFDDGKTKLTQTFDAEADKLLGQLNQVSPLEKTVQTLFPETRDWIYYLSTTPTHLIVGAGPRGRRVPELPVTENTNAPIEMWMRTKGETAAMVTVLKLWKDAGKQLQSLLPEPIGKSIKEDSFRTATVKDWFVIQLGVDRSKGGLEEPGPKPGAIKWRPVQPDSPKAAPLGTSPLGNDIWRPAPKTPQQLSQGKVTEEGRITLVWRPVIGPLADGEGAQFLPVTGSSAKNPVP
ncbi:MAG TPA: hypothetical protein VE988_27960, partial [Gemmataceae bacterium]|nr:hypothetical protein [Gemmataceae bacterium]